MIYLGGGPIVNSIQNISISFYVLPTWTRTVSPCWVDPLSDG